MTELPPLTCAVEEVWLVTITHKKCRFHVAAYTENPFADELVYCDIAFTDSYRYLSEAKAVGELICNTSNGARRLLSIESVCALSLSL